MSFQEWLNISKSTSEDIEKLLKEQTDYNIIFPKEITQPADITAAIEQSSADEAEKAELSKRFIHAWDNYNKEQAAIKKQTDTPTKLSMTRLIVLGLMAVIIVSFLGAAFFGGYNFRSELSQIEFARGMITFLFAAGTIGIAIIIIISVFTSERTSEESEKRFYRAKEILTLLIGILGTIVGFYFGTPTDTQGELAPLELSELIISATPSPVAGVPFTIISQASGGVPPYTYTILVKEGLVRVEEIANKKSEKGLIVESLTIPDGEKEYAINLLIEDAKGGYTDLTEEVKVLGQQGVKNAD